MRPFEELVLRVGAILFEKMLEQRDNIWHRASIHEIQRLDNNTNSLDYKLYLKAVKIVRTRYRIRAWKNGWHNNYALDPIGLRQFRKDHHDYFCS